LNAGLDYNWVQDNQSHSKHGVIRGLHFQNSPYTETKIISCIKGKIWDVAVDLRKNSPTFMNYFAVELSENQHVSVLVPEGFAHGFQSLTDNCQIIYFNTSNYNPNSEGGINALDPRISIKWPIEISFRSIRDTEHQYLKNSFSGIEL
jgi:dTDP-4-dehydrorhamnose 3,5-epimerase